MRGLLRVASEVWGEERHSTNMHTDLLHLHERVQYIVHCLSVDSRASGYLLLSVVMHSRRLEHDPVLKELHLSLNAGLERLQTIRRCISPTKPPNIDCVGKGRGQLDRLVRVCLGVSQRSTYITRYLQQRCDLLWLMSG
jgi:hypothetical protein